jgi:hypothetical protein
VLVRERSLQRNNRKPGRADRTRETPQHCPLVYRYVTREAWS